MPQGIVLFSYYDAYVINILTLNPWMFCFVFAYWDEVQIALTVLVLYDLSIILLLFPNYKFFI